MTAALWIHALGSAPFFASRAFLAAFLTAVFARWGADIPWLGDTSLLLGLRQAPPWFTHDAAIAAFGALAVVEVLAERSPDARAFLDQTTSTLRAVVAVAIQAGLLGAADVDLLPIVTAGPSGEALLLALLVGGLVYWLGGVRDALLRPLGDLDEEDTLGLRGLLLLGEEGAVVGGMLLVFLLPALGLFVVAVTAGSLAWLQRRADAREAAARVPCPACSEPHHPSAPHCPSCDRLQPAPRAVGLLGQARSAAAPGSVEHAFALRTRRRCPHCASRVSGRGPGAACGTCGRPVFADRDALEAYVARVDRRAPVVILGLAGLSFVPLLGLLPGYLLFRLALVLPLRAWLPATQGCTARWGSRVVTVLLLALQPLPVLGAAALPVLGWAHWRVHRRALLGG